MKKRFILSGLALSAMLVLPSMASVTVEQVTEPEFMINQGYSQLSTEDVFVMKNRATGKSIEPLYDKNDNNLFVRGWKSFWGYVDPARDEADRLHHDVKPSPAFTDL